MNYTDMSNDKQNKKRGATDVLEELQHQRKGITTVTEGIFKLIIQGHLCMGEICWFG